MTITKTQIRVLAALIGLTVLTLAFAATPGSAAKKNSDPYYLDYNGQASQEPRNVFFTANSGPRLLKIDWKDWGKRKTVGRGNYRSNCNCPLEVRSRGQLIMRKPVKCVPDFGDFKGEKIRVYKKATLRYIDDGEVRKGRVSSGYGVCR